MFFKSKGILGINARNLLYIRPYNRKKEIKLADDKIKTKQFLSARGIPVPKLYGVIKNTEEIDKFDFNILPLKFVLKPTHGFGGEGIIPIINKQIDKGEQIFIASGGEKFTKEAIKDHIRDILDGRFSISNIWDSAFFEQYIESDEEIGKYSYEGLPDIRIVVHNLIPVMAMLRLPTKESKGKANLHQGAVGVGIDIAKGETTHIAYKNKIIDKLPEGLGDIHGFKIPYWDEILLIASKTQLITNLGYLAADIAIDKNIGPVLIEINARAGLGVQIANLAPLRKRLERIEGISITNPNKAVRIAKDMFGHSVEKEITQVSGKEVIGPEEEIEIIQKKGTLRLSAKIDTGKERSIIDEEIAMKSKLLDDTKNYDDEKSTLKLKLSLKSKRIQTVVDVEKIPSKKYKMIIGNRDLKDFLIDASLEKNKAPKIKQRFFLSKIWPISKKINFYNIDQSLLRIDNKIKLLYHLRPINLESEKQKFFKNTSYNPKFEYPKLKFDPLELVDNLSKIKTDNSILGKIFEEKKQEIADKIALLEAIDEERFTDISIKLFGKPDDNEVELCKTYLSKLDISKIESEKALYTAEETAKIFEQTFKKYELKNWGVKIKENMVADCVAGKNNRLFIKKNTFFTRERIDALIVHEIETHILTAENGKFQPYEIFNKGLANYLITQEGLAMYNVEKQTNTPFSSNFKASMHVIAINQALKGQFIDVYQEISKYGISKENAFRSALKSKRGFMDTSQKGAFTKDYIYFKGYFEIKDFIEKGGDLKDLYIGKINLKNIENIKNIPRILDAKILPKWLK